MDSTTKISPASDLIVNAPAPSKRLVLLIEDERLAQRLITSLLDKEGFETLCAGDGSSALAELKKHKPDIILLDHSLPDMTGLLLLDVIKSHENLRNVPVIYLTGNSQAETKVIALGKGAADYITKPYDTSELLARIFAQLRRKDEEAEKQNLIAQEAAIAHASRMAAEERFIALVKNSPDLVCELDQNLVIRYASPNHKDILSYDSDNLIDVPWTKMVHPDSRKEVEGMLRDMLVNNTSKRTTVRFCNAIGAWRWLDMSGGVQNPGDEQPRLLLVSRDVTRVKETEARLARMALHDPLTELGNRKDFAMKLQRELTLINHEYPGAVVYVDVDNFKLVNDTKGHPVGDDVLRNISEILKTSFSYPHEVFRQGGDEFGVLLRHVTSEQAVEAVEKLHAKFKDGPASSLTRNFGITLSAGIAMIEPKIPLEELLSRADFALYAAKTAGKNRCWLYHTDSKELAHLRSAAEWVPRLRQGLSDDRFCVFYQPMLDLNTMKTFCYEALLRYEDENGKLHSPAAFMPAAERYNLMADIDRHVIGQVLKQLQRFDYFKVSINLSGQSIKEPGLGDFIKSAILAADVDPRRIMFEITETIFITDLPKAEALVEKLRSIGCLFALDDFGSGFSSLNYLKNLPVDIVKIDGAFVEKISQGSVDLALLRAINEIAHMLGKQTVAEYVGSEDACKLLCDIGVDYGQGYYLGCPEPLETVIGNVAMETAC